VGRIDFPKEKLDEFKEFCKQYFGTGKMRLLVIKSKGEAILRTQLATRYDSAYITGLSEQEVDELEKFVGDAIKIWHPTRFFWDEEVKAKVEGEEE